MLPTFALLLFPAPSLATDLQTIARQAGGRLGIAVVDASGATMVNGNARFSLQSVTKLITSAAILDAVDRGKDRIDASIVVHRKDLSVSWQPLAELVGPKGWRTTVGDLIRRTIIESDSAANDILFDRLGGAPAIQAFLRRKGITGIRVDRDERHIQTQSSGLDWRPEYVDPKVLARAEAKVSPARRLAAYRAYQRDPRDTATPKGMADLLVKLASGKLLSPSSTRFLRKAMADCATFPDRLKAGVPSGWSLEHKTGSSGTRGSLTVATNDVGAAFNAKGEWKVLVAFVADSRLNLKRRNAVIAKIARTAFASRN